MNHNRVLTSSLIMLASIFSGQAKEVKPNIILVMCDDLGWGDVGFNGNTTIKTPNIDRMASQGVQLNRFYTACAVSSPTRASVLTGRNPNRTGVYTANAGILRPEEVTIAELLRSEGYYTGHFGKWHLGTLTRDTIDGVRGRIGNDRFFNPPSAHGYDESMTTESKVPTWDPMRKPMQTEPWPDGWNYIKDGEPYTFAGTAYWDHNNGRVIENMLGDDSRIIMDRVIPFIDRSKEHGDPFLAVVWFHAPHKPCVAGAEYAAMYDGYNDKFKNYAGCITAMDDQMGRLAEYLEQSGMAENTLIWFCSDNGPEECDINGGGVTGGFRDRKRSLHEGGVRVPTFVYWPAGIKRAHHSDMASVTSDILPTIVTVVGIDPSKCTNEIDGVDISEVFENGDAKRQRPIVTRFDDMVTYIDNDYKIFINNDQIECYDIVNDPYERNPNFQIPNIEQKIAYIKDRIASYKMSFEGEEYGAKSYNLVKQGWPKGVDLDVEFNVVDNQMTQCSNERCIYTSKPSYDSQRKMVDVDIYNSSEKLSNNLEIRVLYNDRLLVSSAIKALEPNEKRTISMRKTTHPALKAYGYEVIIYDKGVEIDRTQYFVK